MKRCKKCLLMRPEDGFGVDKTRPDNRHPYCKECKRGIEKNARLLGKRSYSKRAPTTLKQSEYMRRCRYNLEPEQYNSMLLAQEGLCKVCKTFMTKPNVDHEHETGVVRGLLCKSCNAGIGLLKDSVALLKSAIEYLTG